MAVGISGHEQEVIAMEPIVINFGTIVIPSDDKWNCTPISYKAVITKLDGSTIPKELKSEPEPKTETWRDLAIKDPLF